MKKVFVSLVVFAMLLALGPVFSLPISAAGAGDRIKMDGNPAVYYLGSDGKRYVFPNQKTYDTWYADFSGVVTVSQSELESYAIGGNVTYRAGTRLGKITTDPKVYAIEPGGVLRWVATEDIAEDLYGANWNTTIDDIPDPFFVNYTVGSDMTDSIYPEGSLVQESGSADIYYIDADGNKRPVSDEAAMTANRFRDEFVQTASDLSTYSDGTSVTEEESDLTTTAGPGGGGTVVGGGSSLTVALASDTPAAGSLVSNSARNKFTKIDFTAPADGDITIDSLTIERQGLANDGPLTPILLESDGVTQIGNSKTLSSTHTATFNEDITVLAGTTKSIYLAANVSTVGTTYAGDMPAFCLKSVSLSGSASTVGTLPVCGNAQTLNGTVTIGSLTVSNGGNNAAASTEKVGKLDKIFSGIQFGPISNEDIQIEMVRFYQNGTAGDSDVENLEFFIDGVQIASAANPVNKYVTIDMTDSPLTIKKGTTKQAYLRGDIVDGSGRTIDFDIYDNIDVVVKGKTYGYYITPSFSQGGTIATAKPYWSGNITTISAGTMSVSKGTLSSINAAEGATQAVLGAFKFNVTGESSEVTALPVHVVVTGTGNGGDVTNLTMYDADGNSVGGPLDPTYLNASAWAAGTDGTATITDTIIFPTGINTYTFKADLNTDFAANDTVQLQLDSPADMTVRGSVTTNTITPTPSTAVSGDTVTIKAGKLSVSQSSLPAAQDVIVSKTDHLFAKYILDASDSGENVNVTQLQARHTTSPSSLHTNITNIILYDTGITDQSTCEENSSRSWDATYGCALNSGQQGESVTTRNATSTITLSNNVLVVEKGIQKTIELRADIAAGSANDIHAFGISDSSVTATGADTGESLTSTYSQSHGQDMTLQTAGKLTTAKDSSWPSNQIAVAGAEKEIIGVLNMTAEWEDIILTDIQFNIDAVNSGNQDEVDTVYLYNEGGDLLGSLTPTSSTWLITIPEAAQNSGAATINVSNTSGEKIYVKADLADIGTGYTGGSGQGFNLDIDGAGDVNGKGADSSSTSINASGTVTGNDVQIYNSIPTITDLSVSSTLTNGSGKELYKFRLTADAAGDVGFYKATFLITTDTATVTSFELYELDGSTETNLTYGSTYPGAYVVDVASSAAIDGQYKLEMGIDSESVNWSGQEYRIIPAGSYRDYVLKGSVANSAAGSSVSVSLCGDDAASTSYPLATSNIDGYVSDDFIWSDLNIGNSTTTATNTAEWVNGYRVSGLESTSTSVTISR